MSDLRVAGVGAAPPIVPGGTIGLSGRAPATSFGDVLQQALGQVNELQQSADRGFVGLHCRFGQPQIGRTRQQ